MLEVRIILSLVLGQYMRLFSFLIISLSSLTLTQSNAEVFDIFEYRNIGPTRGGRVTAVAGTIDNNSVFYLGASGGGVWKTNDYGTSWKNVSDGYFMSPSIGDIAVSQSDENIVYVGTGSDGLRSNVITGNGIYKSNNGGKSWEYLGLDDTGHIGAVEIDPSNHNIVWVAAIGQAYNNNEQRGIFKTVDGGKTWTKVLYISDKVGFSDIELLPGNPEIIFATAWKARRKPWTIISGGSEEESGIYKSINGGETWEKILLGLPKGLTGKIDLAISPADSSIIYALIEALKDEGGLYKSTDQGRSFKQVSNKKGIRTRPFYYGNVDVDPQNPDIVYAMATRYYQSIDGGESWIEMKSPHGDNHDMWINPNDPKLFIQANDGGANVTHNGGKTWSTQFNQPTAELYQVEVDDQYPYWLYAGQQDNSTTIAVPSNPPYDVQHSSSWLIETGGCETGPAVPKPGNHNIVYANCKGKFGVYNKQTGTEKRYFVGAANMYGHNPADLRYRFQRVAPIHVSPHDANVVYHASQFVHKTEDDGATWATISPDLTAFEQDKQVISGEPITRDITGEEFYSTIYSIRESPIIPGVIWTGANDGLVYVTVDNGKVWKNVTPPRVPSGGRVDSVEPSHHDPARAYISILRYQLGDWKPYIYKTDNYGKSWKLLTTSNNGIPNNYPTRVIREDPKREGLLYAGTEYGIFISLDDGRTWKAFQQNLPITPITDIKIHRGDLVLSTMGRSFWVLDDITALRENNFSSLGNVITLFSPKDTIRYRHPISNRAQHTVPQYLPASVAIDYYLPEDLDQPITLEILDEKDIMVNSFTNDPNIVLDEEDDSDSVSYDMSSNEMNVLTNERLSIKQGLHRFRWSMKHTGAWHKDKKKSYKDGPLAKPGNYLIKLRTGDLEITRNLVLITDPRITLSGVSDEDIYLQVDLQLKIIDFLSETRKLTEQLLAEQKSLLANAKNEISSSQDKMRLKIIEQAIKELQTEEGTYMQPMLIDQIIYLYNMTDKADQIPGKEAEDRYFELKSIFSEIVSGLS